MSTSVQYTSAGQQGPFVYSSIDFVANVPTSRQLKLFVNGELKTEGIDYTLDENQQAIYFNAPFPSVGHTVLVKRALETERMFEYQDGDAVTAAELNANYDHLRLLSEDMTDYGTSPLPTRQADNLYELKDVDQSHVPVDGDVFQYNASTALWQAAPLELSLPVLSDVQDSLTPNEGDILYWSGSQWRSREYTPWRPTEQSLVWGSSSQAIGFAGRPSVSAEALTARGPLPNEIPTARDIDDMLEDVTNASGREVTKRVDAALDLLAETPMEAAMLAAVEWKYGIRFASWNDYEQATKDWPMLNGPITYGDTLPDGSEAIIRTTLTSTVTESSGPTFSKNPSKRFLPAKMHGNVSGSLTLDPGAYISYPTNSADIGTSSLWVRDLGGLIREVAINGWRVNASGDHILQVTINLECAQSTKAISVVTNRHGLLNHVSDYSGTLGYAGIYGVFPQGFTMNVPTAWFLDGSDYEPLHFRIYGDRSMEASVTTTTS